MAATDVPSVGVSALAYGVPPVAGDGLPRSSTAASSRLRRLERVWAAMEQQGYAALVIAGRGVISQYGYVEYLTGYTPLVRMSYAVLVPGRDPVLIVPTKADAWYARRAGASSVLVAGEGDVIGDYDRLPEAIAGALEQHAVANGRVGMVGLGHIVSVGDFESLRGQLAHASLFDATALLAGIKAIKDEHEIEQLTETVAIADAGLRAFAAQARCGMSCRAVFGEMERVVRTLGARETLIFISAGPYFLQRPGPEVLERGDLVTVYVELTGPTGYWVERAALFALGPLDAERQRIADACLRAIRAAAIELRPGNTADAVAAAIDEQAAAIGARSGIWHGHGVGIDHDLPVITAGERMRLAEGMVIAVHPNFTDAEERFGASVADTYVLERTRARRLAQIPQKLHYIEAQ